MLGVNTLHFFSFAVCVGGVHAYLTPLQIHDLHTTNFFFFFIYIYILSKQEASLKSTPPLAHVYMYPYPWFIVELDLFYVLDCSTKQATCKCHLELLGAVNVIFHSCLTFIRASD